MAKLLHLRCAPCHFGVHMVEQVARLQVLMKVAINIEVMLRYMLQLQALRKDNVKVVLIHPGPVATSMTKVCVLHQ